MEPFRNERAGLYRPRLPARIPRSVPNEEFNEIFAGLPSHRDQALVTFYVSTGARVSELLSATQGGADPGRQLITLVRKGSGELQELPASSDAFAALPAGHGEANSQGAAAAVVVDAAPPGPAAGLSHGAPHVRAGQAGRRERGDLARVATHSRLPMGKDPRLPLTDVQLVFGHAQLTTMQIYLTPARKR